MDSYCTGIWFNCNGLYLSFGRISGAHLNPAVTIGLLLSKNISLADSVYYIVAQIIGACFGSLAVFLCLGMPSVVVGGLGATAPGMGVSYLQTIFAEFIGTFFLVLVIMGVAVDKKLLLILQVYLLVLQ